MKTALVQSLCSMTALAQRRKTRQFLLGLSTDELQYIAEFHGCCILESETPSKWTREQLSKRIERFDQSRQTGSDRAHKMILLLEFLCRSAPAVASITERANLL